MKNTIYIMAKLHPVTPPELFASIAATHFIETYKHIHSAQVNVVMHRWTRLNINGEPHSHSFLRDSSETRNAEVIVDQDKRISIRSAIAGLLVLKSTGSEFHGFIQDEFTTLPEVHDRILSTEVNCGWRWNQLSSMQELNSAISKFDDAWNSARTITLNTFALESSASIQNSMYKMCEQILAAIPSVATVDYSLPNKHYLEIGKVHLADHVQLHKLIVHKT